MAKDFNELVDNFLEQEKMYHFEGEGGLRNLEKLFSALGYRRTGFKFGEVIEVFLADNPGAQQALVEWVSEQDVPEWAESLESAMLPDEEEDYEDDVDEMQENHDFAQDDLPERN